MLVLLLFRKFDWNKWLYELIWLFIQFEVIVILNWFSPLNASGESPRDTFPISADFFNSIKIFVVVIRGEIKGVFLRCIKILNLKNRIAITSGKGGSKRPIFEVIDFERPNFQRDGFRSEPLSKASSSKLPIFEMLNYEVISYERANFRSGPSSDRSRKVTDFRSDS